MKPRHVPCAQPGCGQLIVFGFNPKTRNRIPLNPEPDPAGNQACRVDVHGSLLARVPTAEDRLEPFERLYMPHFATCAGRAARQEAPTPPTPLPPPNATRAGRGQPGEPTAAAILPFDPARRRRR